MRLFSSTYRIRVKGEGKKTKNSGRARTYAYARNAKKTFVYAFWEIKTGERVLKRKQFLWLHSVARHCSALKRHIGKRAGRFPMCSFAKGQGEERELKPRGISGVF